MKKNGQYVGVDEKYIPEEEKYVDESIIGTTTNEMAGKVKEYLSDDNNRKKAKKVIKGVGIGYLAFVLFIVIMVIVIFAVVIVNFVKIADRHNERANEIQSEIDESNNSIDSFIEDFNNSMNN